MAGPDFQGYGYGTWSNPSMYGHGVNQSQFSVMKPRAGGVGQFASPSSRTVKGPGLKLGLPNWGGQPGAGDLDTTGGVNWGQGRALAGSVMQDALKRNWGRSQAFSAASSTPGSANDQLALGAGSQPSGALGAASQPLGINAAPPTAIGAAPPTAIGAATTMGQLPKAPPTAPGPVVMPSGPRPQGPAPTPIAIGPSGNPGATAGPRSRRQSFAMPGQMKFGEIPA